MKDALVAAVNIHIERPLNLDLTSVYGNRTGDLCSDEFRVLATDATVNLAVITTIDYLNWVCITLIFSVFETWIVKLNHYKKRSTL